MELRGRVEFFSLSFSHYFFLSRGLGNREHLDKAYEYT